MNERAMKHLSEALLQLEEESGDELGVSLRESYSGRGMYGRTTGAITGGLGSILMVIGQACATVATETPDELEDLLSELGGVSRDNMGHDLVIY